VFSPTQTPDLSANPVSTTLTDGQSILLSDDALLRLLFPYISDAIAHNPPYEIETITIVLDDKISNTTHYPNNL